MADPALKSGTIIDGFMLEERLHRAGATDWWRVSRPDVGDPISMKLSHSARLPPAQRVAFEIEQMILAELAGPHVPRLVASGESAVRPYIVMEHVAGQTLSERLSEGHPDLDGAVTLATSLADALADLHHQHVLHLALSPDDILIRPDGEAVLFNFGYARHEHLPDLLDERDHVSAGSAAYLAPEQLQRCRSDKRSDIYAVGAIVYQMVTGRLPFGSPRGTRQARQRIWRDPVPPRTFQPEIEPAFQEVILKCLEPHPAARYASAEELAFDLRHLDLVELTERSGRADNAAAKMTFRRWLRARGTMKAIAAAVTKPAPRPAIVLAAVDLRPGLEHERQALLEAAVNVLANMPGARLSCLCVLPATPVADWAAAETVGGDRHAIPMAGLRAWAEPLRLPRGAVSFHVVEAQSLAKGLIDFAKSRKVDHVVMGAFMGDRAASSELASKITAAAPCAVTIVRAADAGQIQSPIV